MIDNVEILEPDAVHHRVQELLNMGYRFVTITCCNNAGSTFDLFYSFDLDYKLLNVKTTIDENEAVPSVSDVYLAAAFAENEISELFGVKINGLAIDYGGHFMLSDDSPESPFGKGIILVNREGGKNA
jgi:ech hydrogenase subunit D